MKRKNQAPKPKLNVRGTIQGTIIVIVTVLDIIYQLNPIDLINDELPVIGQLDDSAVALINVIVVMAAMANRFKNLEIWDSMSYNQNPHEYYEQQQTFKEYNNARPPEPEKTYTKGDIKSHKL